jgi:hypothetical protein
LPTVEEKIGDMLDAYPERMWSPVSTTHRRKLREDALAEPETVEREVEVGDRETKIVEETVSRSALPWVAVVEEFLRDYEGYRDRYLRMGKGAPDAPEREEFLVPMNNSFAPEYQGKQYARLKALKRQLLGESAEESPTGEEYAGAFSEPVTVLLGLTASSTGDGGEFRPPTDHDREIRDAWGGGDGVRRTLRYVLQDKLGLDSSEYAWWWQSEPHPGGGAASGYSHSHPVVILDAAAADAPLEELDAETFRPVVAKHLAECESAGADAHRLDDTVTVREPGEIEDFASYVSEYLAVDPDDDLLERSTEYIMWAASQWATTTQKYSKSRTATAAIDADRCHQEYADADAAQDADHGERIVRSDRQHVEFECAECGSEFEVDQSAGTLVSARRDGAGAAEVRADGGTPNDAAGDSGDTRPSLASLWPSARGGGRVGAETQERECRHEDGAAECPLCCPPGETVPAGTPIPESATAPPGEEIRDGFERPAEWEAEAVVQKATGEESVLGSPGGVGYGEVVVEGADAIPPEKLIPPAELRTPNPSVDPTEYPPPELVERQLGEIHRGDPVTAKRWSEDWHAERYGDGAGEESVAEGLDRDAVRRYAENSPGASVVEIMASTGAPPSARPFVESVVGD